MKKRIITLLAILALLVTCTVIAAQAEGITLETSAQTPFNGLTDKCPHCNTVITDWVELGASTSFVNGTHYKVSADLQLTGVKSAGTNKVVVWIQDNVTVTAAAGSNAFRSNGSGGQLWLLGGENSVVTGTGATASHGSNGGLLRVLLGGSIYIDGDLTIQLSAKISGGISSAKKGMGGLVDVNNGNLYFRGGTMISAQAETGNVGDVTGAIKLSGATGKLEMSGGRILTKGAKNNAISCAVATTVVIKGDSFIEGTKGYSSVYMTNGTLTIDGNATILKPTAGGENAFETNIYIKNPAKLQIAQTWDGEASVKFLNSSGTQQTLQPGGTSYSAYVVQVILKEGAYVQNTWNSEGTGNAASESKANASFDGYMICESPDTDNPRLNGWQHLIMPRRLQIVYADGSKTWETDYNNACDVVAKTAGSYIKVWAVNRTFTVDANQTVYIDLNGKDYTSKATVNGKLYVFDSKAAVGEAGKTINATNVEPITLAPNGKIYATVAGAPATTYEIGVTAKVDSVNFRPTTAGLYYGATATFTGAAEAVAVANANLKTGVAVSVNPIENFTDTAWTANDANTGYGILVDKILKDEAEWDNAGYADTTIYAEACVTYGDKLVFLSDNDVAYSLTGVMELVAAQFADNENAKAFYAKWALGEGLSVAAPIDAWAANDKLSALAAAE